MPAGHPIIKSPIQDVFEGNRARGHRPVIFDLVSFDGVTPLLPDFAKLVLHVNPSDFAPNYTKVIDRIQTRGGWVEQHWGESLSDISITASTGAFLRLFVGVTGQYRRETINYSKYLDLLTLYYNNGSIYDQSGSIVLQGRVRITYDGGEHIGWFTDFNVSESSDGPFVFEMSANFKVEKEIWSLKTHASGSITPQMSSTFSLFQRGQTP